MGGAATLIGTGTNLAFMSVFSGHFPDAPVCFFYDYLFFFIFIIIIYLLLFIILYYYLFIIIYCSNLAFMSVFFWSFS